MSPTPVETAPSISPIWTAAAPTPSRARRAALSSTLRAAPLPLSPVSMAPASPALPNSIPTRRTPTTVEAAHERQFPTALRGSLDRLASFFFPPRVVLHPAAQCYGTGDVLVQ